VGPDRRRSSRDRRTPPRSRTSRSTTSSSLDLAQSAAADQFSQTCPPETRLRELVGVASTGIARRVAASASRRRHRSRSRRRHGQPQPSRILVVGWSLGHTDALSFQAAYTADPASNSPSVSRTASVYRLHHQQRRHFRASGTFTASCWGNQPAVPCPANLTPRSARCSAQRALYTSRRHESRINGILLPHQHVSTGHRESALPPRVSIVIAFRHRGSVVAIIKCLPTFVDPPSTLL
jgi:hypothetical protein